MKRSMQSIALSAVILAIAIGSVLAGTVFETFQPNQQVRGFTVENLYLNARNEAFGARLRHVATGFTMDLFELQSVPQAFLWVSTPVLDDRGEPHAGEHLLLGKGNKARFVSSQENMFLGKSTAYTATDHTVYPFSSEGGNDIFYTLFESQMDALLYPDFSDEEIRREVCHIGVEADPNTGALRLDEKGTVYTEMVSVFEKPWDYLEQAMATMIYGENHPLCKITGGEPAAMREMQPSHMREFHNRYYRLDNIGMITTIPADMVPETFMARTDSILNRLAAAGGNRPVTGREKVPPPQSTTPPGTVKMVTYPGAGGSDPGYISMGWPATLSYDNTERFLIQAFLYCLGGSETSNLYNKFINSSTRAVDLGSASVYAGVDDNVGHPVSVFLANVDPAKVTEAEMTSLAKMVQDEIAAIAAYPAGSPQLKEFNDRAGSRLREMAKDAEAYLNSPPGFGLRGGNGGGWYGLMRVLENQSGFKKSLLQKEERAAAAAELAKNENIWTALVAKWKLTAVKPYLVGCVPDPQMLVKTADEKKARLDAFAQNLVKKYNTADVPSAIAAYKVEFDRQTAELDSIAALVPVPKFLDNPPLSFDPTLDYRIDTVAGMVPMVASTFNSMTASTMTLALNLRGIPEAQLLYVPLLPDLITEVGVVKDGQVIDYAALSQRLKNEVLYLYGDLAVNPYTGRVDLAVTAAGSSAAEGKAALEWAAAGLQNPYLAPANLPRLRDVVDNRIVGLRNRMKGSEEGWVQGPAVSYLYQNDPLILAAFSFLTQEDLMLRLKWRLMAEKGNPAAAEAITALNALAGVSGQPKNDLVHLAETFSGGDRAAFGAGPFATFTSAYEAASPEARKIIDAALADLAATVPSTPEANAAADWTALVTQMTGGLQYGAQAALDDLAGLLRIIAHRGNARLAMVSNEADRATLTPSIAALVARLSTEGTPARVVYTKRPFIWDRARSRYPGLEKPAFVGLINPNTRNGVFVNSAPCADYTEVGQERLLDFLAAKLYGGHGAHSMFMKTWSAGLAYSNGLRSSEVNGRLTYYAERCPDLSTTMRFVVDQLRQAPYSPELGEYAVALAFDLSRGSNDYVSRGMAMAANLTDGVAPEKVEAFRKRILELRRMPDLYDRLQRRMENVYAQVLIGYGPKTVDRSRSSYFIIGPETQFASLDEYIGSLGGLQPVSRLYPRDFWLVD